MLPDMGRAFCLVLRLEPPAICRPRRRNAKRTLNRASVAPSRVVRSVMEQLDRRHLRHGILRALES